MNEVFSIEDGCFFRFGETRASLDKSKGKRLQALCISIVTFFFSSPIPSLSLPGNRAVVVGKEHGVP